MSEKVTVLARITGRVQGVWYRGWAADQAQALGIDGWVRNEPDGSVQALLHGPQDPVASMLKALEEGPPAARVVSVTSENVAETVEQGFRVKR